MPINDPIMSAEALKFLEYKRIVVDMFQASVRFEPDGTLKQSSEPIAEVASKARECGVLMQITPEYLVNQTDSYKVLLDAGVTAFSTVYPSVAKRALDEYYQVPPANADNASPNN